jgi:hypothetical protein
MLQVMDLVLNELIAFFSLPNPALLYTALESTQPLTEISIRNPLGGVGGGQTV